jgi:hypothetical protein
MPGAYEPSTIESIGDIRNGMLVETGVLAFGTWGAAVQAELFTVHNRIMLLGLWCEVVTTLTGDGCLLYFNWTSTVPVIGVQPITAVCTNIHGFVRGRRISFVGTAYNTAAAVTYAAGISYHNPNPMILGVAPTAAGVQSVSQIGCLSTTVNLTVGTAKFGCLYTPIDAGSYVEALL